MLDRYLEWLDSLLSNPNSVSFLGKSILPDFVDNVVKAHLDSLKNENQLSKDKYQEKFERLNKFLNILTKHKVATQYLTERQRIKLLLYTLDYANWGLDLCWESTKRLLEIDNQLLIKPLKKGETLLEILHFRISEYKASLDQEPSDYSANEKFFGKIIDYINTLPNDNETFKTLVNRKFQGDLTLAYYAAHAASGNNSQELIKRCLKIQGVKDYEHFNFEGKNIPDHSNDIDGTPLIESHVEKRKLRHNLLSKIIGQFHHSKRDYQDPVFKDQLLENPVTSLKTGVTYSQSTANFLIKHNLKCPITKQKIRKKDLVTDDSVQKFLQDYKKNLKNAVSNAIENGDIETLLSAIQANKDLLYKTDQENLLYQLYTKEKYAALNQIFDWILERSYAKEIITKLADIHFNIEHQATIHSPLHIAVKINHGDITAQLIAHKADTKTLSTIKSERSKLLDLAKPHNNPNLNYLLQSNNYPIYWLNKKFNALVNLKENTKNERRDAITLHFFAKQILDDAIYKQSKDPRYTKTSTHLIKYASKLIFENKHKKLGQEILENLHDVFNTNDQQSAASKITNFINKNINQFSSAYYHLPGVDNPLNWLKQLHKQMCPALAPEKHTLKSDNLGNVTLILHYNFAFNDTSPLQNIIGPTSLQEILYENKGCFFSSREKRIEIQLTDEAMIDNLKKYGVINQNMAKRCRQQIQQSTKNNPFRGINFTMG